MPETDPNRRSYARVEAQIYCRPARMRLTPLPVSNIGLGGMRVYSDDANKVGQLLDIDVLADGDTVTCTVEVAWISRLAEPAPAKYDVGLRFVSVPPGFLHYLSELTATRGTGTVAILVNPHHKSMATESMRRLMTEIDDLQAMIVHDADTNCSCLSEVDSSAPWLDRVSFVKADLRRGHSFALNTALRRALGREEATEWFLLITPDIVVESGAVKALLNVLEEQPHVGIVGSHVVNDAGEPQPTVFSFPTLGASIGSNPSPDTTGPVPWVSATCVMIRRDVVDNVGLFDDNMHSHFSAADFCHRAARDGWQTWHARESNVSSATLEPFSLDDTPARDRPVFLASRDRFLSKNYSHFSRWLSVLGSAARLLITSIWCPDRRAQWHDMWRYYLRPRLHAPDQDHNNPQK